MKTLMSIAALLAIAVMGVAIAQEKIQSDQKCSRSDKAHATGKACDGACPISVAMGKLPKMSYRVGTESTCCAHSAESLAKESSEPITYVVAEETYEDKTEAYTALVEETEAYVNAYITPKKCSKSGKTTVAGKACGCTVEAGKRAELVSAAVKKVKMSYKVGDEEVCCSKMAADLAEKTGETTHYLVAGEETSCDLTARLKLAIAKYEAAVQAISSADKSADASKNDSATSGT